MTSRRSQENMLSVKGIDRQLWKWLKARAALEGKTAGSVINELIDRYRKEEGWSDARLLVAAQNRDTLPSLTVRGINQELWEWLKARAVAEDTTAGEIINVLIERYRRDGASRLQGSPYTHDPQHIINIRGIDRELWKSLKDHATLEEKTVGEMLNELIHQYRREVRLP